jgi:hypothetical protein
MPSLLMNGKAVAFDRPIEPVVVIDSDPDQSGASATDREGS